MVQIIRFLFQNSKISKNYFIIIFMKSLFYKLKYNKYLFVYPFTEIKGIENMEISKALHIGTVNHELNHHKDLTKISVRGKLQILGEHYHIGRGCRIDIGKNSELKIGKGGFINPFTNIIVRHGVSIGENTYISWNCLLLDEDYHTVNYDGKAEKNKKIEIGNHVWIGTGVSVYQGTRIADGCVVASDSVLRGEYNQPNCIIAGHPAKIIKENISWE